MGWFIRDWYMVVFVWRRCYFCWFGWCWLLVFCGSFVGWRLVFGLGFWFLVVFGCRWWGFWRFLGCLIVVRGRMGLLWLVGWILVMVGWVFGRNVGVVFGCWVRFFVCGCWCLVVGRFCGSLGVWCCLLGLFLVDWGWLVLILVGWLGLLFCIVVDWLFLIGWVDRLVCCWLCLFLCCCLVVVVVRVLCWVDVFVFLFLGVLLYCLCGSFLIWFCCRWGCVCWIGWLVVVGWVVFCFLLFGNVCFVDGWSLLVGWFGLVLVSFLFWVCGNWCCCVGICLCCVVVCWCYFGWNLLVWLYVWVVVLVLVGFVGISFCVVGLVCVVVGWWCFWFGLCWLLIGNS